MKRKILKQATIQLLVPESTTNTSCDKPAAEKISLTPDNLVCSDKTDTNMPVSFAPSIVHYILQVNPDFFLLH